MAGPDQLEELRRAGFAIAYRMLGSVAEAEDVVQEALLRLVRAEDKGEQIESPQAYLSTVVTRLAIDQLRSARARRETYVGEWLPEPLVTDPEEDPARHAEMADSLSTKFLVLLESLSPEQRAAFLLHDVFDYSYGQIAELVGVSEDNARQLASRARRRVQGAAVPDTDLAGQRQVVDAFLAAARDGDFDALVAVLDPDIVLRSDGGVLRPGASTVMRGATAVASQALLFRRLNPYARPALVNGAAGLVVNPEGRPFSVIAFTVRRGRIVEIDVLADPERLRRLDLTILGP